MILDKIVYNKKKEVEKDKKRFPLERFKNQLTKSDRNFKKAISTGSLNLIAEIKKKSPSKGLLRKNFNPLEIAKIYNRNESVKAISVLTDRKYFGGSKELMKRISKVVRKPILRKDFIIDPYQIYQSRFYKADALLLIARILTKNQIKLFIKTAKRYQMDCLVEIHSRQELKKLPINVEIIGINNRGLDTLKINLDKTRKISKLIKNKIIVTESGFNNKKDIKSIKSNVNAVLIGASLMKSKDINKKINGLIEKINILR